MRFILTVLVVLQFLSCSAQVEEEIKAIEGIEARIYKSFKLSKNLSLKINALGRDGFLTVFQIPNVASTPSRADINLAVDRKMGPYSKIAIGTMYRLSGINNAARLFQQFGWAQKVNSRVDAIAHRLRVDETFRENSTETRLRYRIAIETPLSGYRLDSEENYFAISTEVLQKFNADNTTKEIRLNPRIGRLFKNKNKAEIGIDFRYDRPFSDEEEKLFLLQFRHYLSE